MDLIAPLVAISGHVTLCQLEVNSPEAYLIALCHQRSGYHSAG